MQIIKNIILSVAFSLCLYAIFGGYIAAMFNGKLPFMQRTEPARMCAAFQDGTKYGRDSTLSIDAYHENTGQSFEMVECN